MSIHAMCFLFVVMFVHACVCVGGDVGGLENARNVEGCNQNVLLCGRQKKKTGKKEYCSQ